MDIEGLMDPSVLAMIAHSEALSLAFDLKLIKLHIDTNCRDGENFGRG